MNNLPRHFHRTAAALLLMAGVIPSVIAQEAASAAEAITAPEGVTQSKSVVTDDALARELITRQAERAHARDVMNEGTRLFERGEFEKAISKYNDVILILQPTGSNAIPTAETQAEIDATKKCISNAYYSWAMECIQRAESLAELGEFTSAIDNCKKAIEFYPQLKKVAEQQIAKFERMRKSVEYTKDLTLDEIDKEYPNKMLQIERYLQQGRNFYKVGRWDKARDAFQEVISLDPYNEDAINSLRLTYTKMIEAGNMRMKSTALEGVVEVIWDSLAPIYPKGSETSNDIRPVVDITLDPTKNIRNKLDSIIIDNLEFEAVDIRTVIKHLRRRSKERDPDEEGVNFVLLLPVEETTTAVTGGGGDFGFDEEEDDDSFGFGEEVGGAAGETQYLISVQSKEVPLSTAIKYVCESGDLHFRVDENAIVVAPKTVTLASFERRDYPLDRDSISASIDNPEDPAELQKYFEARAVTFEPGATVSYKPDISRLYVKNTPENHAQIAEIIRHLDALDPQVLIQVKFLEINNNDLEELGFQYVVSREASNDKLNNLKNASPQQILPAPSETTSSIKIGDTYYYQAPTDMVLWNYVSAEGSEILGGQGSTSKPEQVGDYSIIKKGEYFTFGDGQTVWATPYSTAKSATTFSPNDPLVRSAGDDPNVFGSNNAVNDGIFTWSWYNSNGYKVNARVNAVDQADSSDILSTPRIMTMNGQPATIRMVTEKYYPTEWSEAELDTVSSGNETIPVVTPSIPSFGEVTEEGIILRVSPNVDPDGNDTITLEMSPVIQHMIGWTDYSYKIPLGDNGDLFDNILKMPIIEKRQVDTLVSCLDGETIVLGGIIKDHVSEVNDQYPILGDIPLVGRIFQTKGRGSQKTNLLIFLTCRLVHPDGTFFRPAEERSIPSF